MRRSSELSRLAQALGGLPILGCLKSSPAAQAGVRYGDVLLSINGVPTPTWDTFLAVRQTCQGRFVARIFRDGAEIDVEIPLRQGPLPSPLEVLSELVSADDDDDADGGAADLAN